jgi:hypothetical protein
VTISVTLGAIALVFGLELLRAFGSCLEAISGLLLVGFGVAYGLRGLRRTIAERAHAHAHAHGHAHVHRHDHGVASIHRPLTAWTLFLLFSADPCIAVIPLMFAAAPLGWISALLVVSAYELATIGTMIALVLPASAAVANVGGVWADRWGDALAGGVVATIGLAVMVLGI